MLLLWCVHQDTPKGVDAIKTDLTALDTKLSKKIEKEAADRQEKDDEIKEDINTILGRRDVTVPSLVNNKNAI